MATNPVEAEATPTAVRLLATALDIQPSEISVDSQLGALRNWDSLGHAQVVAAIEELIGRELSTQEILGAVDFTAVVELVRSCLEPAANLRPNQPS